MTFSWFRRMFRKKSQPIRTSVKRPARRRFLPGVEPLSDRVMPAITAAFNPTAGLLSVFGDAQANTIVVSRDAAGRILVNGGAVAIQGGLATVANTSTIQVFGQDGNDTISLDEASGTLPAAFLFGGNGNDILTGGSGADLLFGQAGNDTLLGKGGDDQLFGGDGNDVLTGGVGTDQAFGEAGNDRMIWNPGEGTDLNEGGDGIDTVEVNGGNGAETFTITANGTRVRFDRVTPAPFSIDIGTSENLVLNANGGDDVVTAGNGLSTLIALTVDGGTGNDTITGGDGNDTLIGGDGNDVINGGRGNDTVQLGAGDDTFVWNPGDGSDTVDGQTGADTLQFNGSNIGEKFDLSADHGRVRLFRDIGNVTMDVAGFETVNVVALGGADTVTVGDLTGTGVTNVNLDLGATAGSGIGDGVTDTVIVNGTSHADNIQVAGSGTSYAVTGLPATVAVQGSEGTNDQLVVSALGGNDTVSAITLPAAIVNLTLDGGVGNDTLVGSAGNDMLIGGDGNDVITGGRGADTALMGADNDTFVWNPGDGSDSVDGQGGRDTMIFNGANVAEKFDLSANGTHLRLFRDVGNVTMDVAAFEAVNIAGLGDVDAFTVNDLTGTGIVDVNIDLSGAPGVGDGAADTILVSGTQDADGITVSGSGTSVAVTGLFATLHITQAEGANDSLRVSGLGGADRINASRLNAGVIALTLDGGEGDDAITGSAGNDTVFGGRGNDTVFLGAGDDTFVWNPGDGSDSVDGQQGRDTLVFNGANINEKIDLSANGSRLRLSRDVANVTMDVGSTEVIDVNALGGADTLTVNDLSKTAVTDVNIDLASSPGSDFGDGAADTVIVNGTNASDTIGVAGSGGSADVTGLSARVHISGAESANDRLVVSAGKGDDVVQASALAANAIQLTADGGDGADVLVGGAGNDTLLGGIGDDILIGGPGQDVLDGGPGNNTLIQ